jgi:abortive infection bacteriophage resistance protein
MIVNGNRREIKMSDDKYFLTYNQQMRKLRNDKKIICSGSNHKRILIRAGYFNIINGYKSPFVCGTDNDGNHIYISNTSVDQMYYVKQFDDELRSFLLRYITQVEEEVRTLTGYQFDKCNDDGKIAWYDTNAYNPKHSLQNKMSTISSAYSELSKSHLDYVKFYMENHKQIPTWIMLKVVNFSTFISVLQYSKTDVTHSICQLYGMSDINNLPNVKLLIGSLHWMRKIRNSCAHNERIYCLCRDRDKFHRNSGRINEQYICNLRPAYKRDTCQRIFDLIVYFKYYLPNSEYKTFISKLYDMLSELQQHIQPNAFEYVRGKMGIRNLNDLNILKDMPKDDIDYNKFDK